MADSHNDENQMPHPNTTDENDSAQSAQKQAEEREQEEEQPKRQKSDHSTGVSTGNVVSVLSQTVAGLQNAMGMVCQKMSASLEKNLTMMNQMNECMEHYVQAGLKLSVQVLPSKLHINGERGPSLKISIRNSARIPIPKVTFSLTFMPDGQAVEPQILLHENEVAASRKRVREEDESARFAEDQPVWQAADAGSKEGTPTLTSDGHSPLLQCAAVTLKPGQHILSEFSTRFRTVTLHRGLLLASLPSPGTGAALTVECPFKVRVVDQLERTWARRGAETENWQQCGGSAGGGGGGGGAAGTEAEKGRRRVGAGRLREAFAIPGREGIEEGSVGTLRVAGGGCQVCVVTVCEGAEEEEQDPDSVAVRVKVCTELGKVALSELGIEV